jgi:hypothetical protein
LKSPVTGAGGCVDWAGAAAMNLKASKAQMRSAIIVTLFLFSMLFLGAQAAQLDPPKPRDSLAAQSAQTADATLFQQVGY